MWQVDLAAGDRNVTLLSLMLSCASSAPACVPAVLTCLQVPQVFAAHLVVPALAVAVAAAPDVEAGAHGGGAVSSPGSGPAGVGVVDLRPLVLELGLDVLLLLWAQALPAQRV